MRGTPTNATVRVSELDILKPVADLLALHCISMQLDEPVCT